MTSEIIRTAPATDGAAPAYQTRLDLQGDTTLWR